MGSAFYNSDVKCRELMEFFGRLYKRFPPMFAMAALEDDHRAKHSVTEPKTGRDLGTRGSKWRSGMGIPGIYWFNVFGQELVEHFGRESLLRLDSTSAFAITDKCIALQAYSSPTEKDSGWRRACEAGIVASLGPEYFFDNEYHSSVKRPRRRKAIPGLEFKF